MRARFVEGERVGATSSNRPAGMVYARAAPVVGFVHGFIAYDGRERTTAKAALSHPFLAALKQSAPEVGRRQARALGEGAR